MNAFLDFETRSRVDLKKQGIYPYAEDPSTEIMCLAYSIDGAEGRDGMTPHLVLDMCCGPRMMWFDKADCRAVFTDRRKERHALDRPKRGTVEYTETRPDVQCDFTRLPFAAGVFALVVFDPPHFERSGKPGFLAKKYGWLDGDWRGMLRLGFAEGFRVLRDGGTLIFKWTATENPVSEILKLTPVKPLFGHKSGKQSQTHWLTFSKPATPEFLL